MSEWKKYKLSEFIEINPKVTLKSGIQHSFVEMKDLNESRKYVIPSQLKAIKGGARFQNSDTLFARITPCLQNGKICQVQGLKNSVGFGSTEFLVFRGKDGISNTDFIYYLSRYDVVRKFAEQNMIGTSGRQRVSKDAFANLELYLPELSTQTAIAEILSSLDDKIELNNKINQDLETLAQTLFKQWFIDFEFPNDNREPYKSSGGEMVDSALGEIPKGWTTEVLSEATKLIRGISYRKPELVLKGEGIAFVNLKCFSLNGTFRQDGIKYFNGKYKNEQLLSKNDILVAVTDLTQDREIIGMPILWNGGTTALPSLDTCIIRSETSELKNFLYYEFKTKRYKSRIIEHANGSTVLHLSVKGLETYVFPLPTDELLNNWFGLIQPILEKINSNIKEINELSITRDTLLPKLISGKLEINEISN